MNCDLMNDRLLEHWYTIADKYQIWFLALYGSQNYGLDDETSDVDTKALIIPTFDGFFHKDGIKNKTYLTNHNEHIEVKDAYSMTKNFQKQNINFLEILFTPHVMVNDELFEEWKALYDMREDIAHVNMHQAVKAMQGMAKNKYDNLCTSHPSVEHLIEQYGYDGKQLSNILRLGNFVYNYTQYVPFEECLTKHNGWNFETLIKAKKQKYSLNEAKKLADIGMEWINLYTDNFLKNTEQKVDIRTIKEVDNIVYSVYKKTLKKELLS